MSEEQVQDFGLAELLEGEAPLTGDDYTRIGLEVVKKMAPKDQAWTPEDKKSDEDGYGNRYSPYQISFQFGIRIGSEAQKELAKHKVFAKSFVRTMQMAATGAAVAESEESKARRDKLVRYLIAKRIGKKIDEVDPKHYAANWITLGPRLDLANVTRRGRQTEEDLEDDLGG